MDIHKQGETGKVASHNKKPCELNFVLKAKPPGKTKADGNVEGSHSQHTYVIWVFTVCQCACYSVYLGDKCIRIFQLERYIVGYTVRNLVLRRRASGAVKRDFRTYKLCDDIFPQMKILNLVIPIVLLFCCSTQIGALQDA